MPIQSFWLTSLLFITSVTAHAYPPMGLKPRYLSTGTGISPAFPTKSANGTAVLTGTTYSPPSISTAAPTSTSSAAAPSSTSSDFHLVAAGTGTYLDGYYLIVNGARGSGPGDLQVMVFIEELPLTPLVDVATFHLAANGTLVNGYGGEGKAFGFPADNYWFFNRNTILEPYEVFESVCDIVGGELRCATGPNTVFYICVEVFVDGPFAGEPINDRDLIPLLGPAVNSACSGVELTLLVVPV